MRIKSLLDAHGLAIYSYLDVHDCIIILKEKAINIPVVCDKNSIILCKNNVTGYY